MLWPSAQAETCRLALGLKRLDTPAVTSLLASRVAISNVPPIASHLCVFTEAKSDARC